MAGADIPVAVLAVQLSQVTFQQFTAGSGQAGDLRRGQESAQVGEGGDHLQHAAWAGAGGEPPSAHPFGQLFQPGLGDAGEAEGGDPVGIDS